MLNFAVVNSYKMNSFENLYGKYIMHKAMHGSSLLLYIEKDPKFLRPVLISLASEPGLCSECAHMKWVECISIHNTIQILYVYIKMFTINYSISMGTWLEKHYVAKASR